MKYRHIVIMGVSGSGKSTVGEELSPMVGLPYLDGDDLHPQANIDKMAAGSPLNDADRWPWLESIGVWLSAQADGALIGCSALKRSYRDLIRSHCPSVVFLHVHGDYELLRDRMNDRAGHFMPVTLLQSQFDTLEALGPDETGRVFDVSDSPTSIAGRAARWIESGG